LLRVSDTASDLGLGGQASGDFFLWNTAADDDHDATQWLGELL
jgi:hypothetical protein